MILASAYDHSPFVGETRASGRSKRTQLHSGPYRNFNLITIIEAVRQWSAAKFNLDPIETGWPWIGPTRTSNV